MVAPLDWGLGHATRCVPVIRELQRQGFEVLAGAEKAGAALLQKEFPELTILPLKGYRISYSKRKVFFFLKMLMQGPKIVRAVKTEHEWLKQVIINHQIDIVISDNRYGLWNEKIKSVFITHQLFIKTGNAFLEKQAQRTNYNYIKKFDECWVPDAPGPENLAGALSHPVDLPPVPVKYIGTLSRFESRQSEKTIDLLVMISGPEPQRTLLENTIIRRINRLPYTAVLVRGLPQGGKPLVVENKSVLIYDHLPAAALSELMAAAKTVIARSGYSTVMDLAAMQQQAILIPTPGQAEQEYLAKYLSDKKYCIAATQSGLDVQHELQRLASAALLPFPAVEPGRLREAINLL